MLIDLILVLILQVLHQPLHVSKLCPQPPFLLGQHPAATEACCCSSGTCPCCCNSLVDLILILILEILHQSLHVAKRCLSFSWASVQLLLKVVVVFLGHVYVAASHLLLL